MATASPEQDFPPLLPAEAAFDFSSPPIAIKVGSPNPQMFYVDESVLRKSSKFFDAALKKEWKEGQQRTVDLPECDPEGFKVYINWLHSGKIYAKLECDEDSDRCYDLLTKAKRRGGIRRF
ncbi:hypothetical protein CKM354_000673600 [Cercospora kikuchii]|uniref:BTB domain-containing protein n=1 Tax=Cercospora kikuchii TaxID=84275 RepID=A0A9P3CHW7_9PEZI|nr:uncharacterized protein CKM354_000673600 [Cercospora kikuchii]GIZ43512.1 hypothetical protein CKM354_000673600 [Cercospora kikuchii]